MYRHTLNDIDREFRRRVRFALSVLTDPNDLKDALQKIIKLRDCHAQKVCGTISRNQLEEKQWIHRQENNLSV